MVIVADLSRHECEHGVFKKLHCVRCNPIKKVENMKLTNYIQEHYNGNVSEFARANNYHLRQVNRYIEQDAEYNSGEPFFKKYLNEKKDVPDIHTTNRNV